MPRTFSVYDRKVSPLSRFSAVNPRYWVIDSETNLPVDEFTSARAARDTARDLTREYARPEHTDQCADELRYYGVCAHS